MFCDAEIPSFLALPACSMHLVSDWGYATLLFHAADEMRLSFFNGAVLYFLAISNAILNFGVLLALETTNLYSGSVDQMTHHFTCTCNLALAENYQQSSHRVWQTVYGPCYCVLLSPSKRVSIEDVMMWFCSI